MQHGKNLCLQEKTLPAALRKAGYTTALFGKWHLNGVRGNGVPILGDDPVEPVLLRAMRGNSSMAALASSIDG